MKVRQKLAPLVVKQETVMLEIRELEKQVQSKMREEEVQATMREEEEEEAADAENVEKGNVMPSLVQVQFEDNVCPVTGEPYIGGGELALFPCGCQISRAGAEDWLIYGRRYPRMETHPMFEQRVAEGDVPTEADMIDCPLCGKMLRATMMSDQEAIDEEMDKQEAMTRAEVTYADHCLTSIEALQDLHYSRTEATQLVERTYDEEPEIYEVCLEELGAPPPEFL